MKEIINLKDLLKHEILDLCSAEDQILECIPDMVDNVARPALKGALSDHFMVSKSQKERLLSIKKMLGDDVKEGNKGFFSKLFGGKNSITSKGIEGIINEANALINEEITPQAKDAAIIGLIQKINHYQIAGYGTAKAYALELKLQDIAGDLDKSLKEEYESDAYLTKLAVNRINIDAENALDTDLPYEDEDDMERITNSISIMRSSEPGDYE